MWKDGRRVPQEIGGWRWLDVLKGGGGVGWGGLEGAARRVKPQE